MKKFSILGLLLSLFAVFALVSCGKDDEPKSELEGKTFFEQNVREYQSAKYFSDKIYAFKGNKFTLEHKEYTQPASENPEDNYYAKVVYEYAYNTKTSVVKLVKVVSAVIDGKEKTNQYQKEFEETKKKQGNGDIVISYDKAEQRLVFKETKQDKEVKTTYIPLKK